MVHVILPAIDGIIYENIPDLCKLYYTVPEFSYSPQFSHFLIQRCQLINKARNFRVIVLQPLHFFILDRSIPK